MGSLLRLYVRVRGSSHIPYGGSPPQKVLGLCSSSLLLPCLCGYESVMTGYTIGPQFFRGFKTNVSQVALGTLLCVTGLLTALVLAKLMGYDKGTTAGL